MRAAIYARVSTERQERQQTIDSQLSALRGWVSAQGHVLAEPMLSATRASAARVWIVPPWMH
jgi:DNA invertase Pin-like site-specific DNA recombinase